MQVWFSTESDHRLLHGDIAIQHHRAEAFGQHRFGPARRHSCRRRQRTPAAAGGRSGVGVAAAVIEGRRAKHGLLPASVCTQSCFRTQRDDLRAAFPSSSNSRATRPSMSAVALRSVLIPAIQTSSLRHAHTGRSMAARIANGEIRSMHTVVMCRPLHASGMALLEARHDVTIRTLDRPSAQDLAAAMPGAHAVLVGLEKVDEALLARRARPAHRVALRRRLRHGGHPRLHAARRRGRRHQWRQ